MISLIVKSYLSVLLSVAAGALLLVVGGIIIIFRLFSSRTTASTVKSAQVSAPAKPVLQAVETNPNELSAIAGDDLVATQLDLARAYLEIDNHAAAAKLLEVVSNQGSQSQQEEAKRLITHIADLQFVERVRKKSRT